MKSKFKWLAALLIALTVSVAATHGGVITSAESGFDCDYDFEDGQIPEMFSASGYSVSGGQLTAPGNWNTLLYNREASDYVWTFDFKQTDGMVIVGFNIGEYGSTDNFYNNSYFATFQSSGVLVLVDSYGGATVGTWYYSSDENFVDGEWHTFSVKVLGGDFRISMDGEVLAASSRDSLLTDENFICSGDKASGKLGIIAYGAGDGGFALDNFKVTADDSPFFEEDESFDCDYDFEDGQIPETFSASGYSVSGGQLTAPGNWNTLLYNREASDYVWKFDFKQTDGMVIAGFSIGSFTNNFYENAYYALIEADRVLVLKDSPAGAYVGTWHYSSDENFVNGEWHTFSVKVLGGDFQISMDGEVLAASSRDSLLTDENFICSGDKASGKLGIIAYGAGDGGFALDNFKVTADDSPFFEEDESFDCDYDFEDGQIPETFSASGYSVSGGQLTAPGNWNTLLYNREASDYVWKFDFKQTDGMVIVGFSIGSFTNNFYENAYYALIEADRVLVLKDSPAGAYVGTWHYSSDENFVNGEWHTFSVKVLGGDFQISMDGEVLAASSRDSLLTDENFICSGDKASGKLGIIAYGAGDGGFALDNFKVTADDSPFFEEDESFDCDYDFEDGQIPETFTQSGYSVSQAGVRQVLNNHGHTSWDPLVYSKLLSDFNLSLAFRAEAAHEDATIVMGFNAADAAETDKTGIRINITQTRIQIFRPVSGELMANWMLTRNLSLIDGKWHTIELKVRGGSFYMLVDGENIMLTADTVSGAVSGGIIAGTPCTEGYTGLIAYRTYVEYDYFRIQADQSALSPESEPERFISSVDFSALPAHWINGGSVDDGVLTLEDGQALGLGGIMSADISFNYTVENAGGAAKIVLAARKGSTGGVSGGYRVEISASMVSFYVGGELVDSFEFSLLGGARSLKLSFNGNAFALVYNNRCLVKVEDNDYYYGEWELSAEDCTLVLSSLSVSPAGEYEVLPDAEEDDDEIIYDDSQPGPSITPSLPESGSSCSSGASAAPLFILAALFAAATAIKIRLKENT